MATKPLPSPEVLRQLLTYDPETGKLFWKERGPEWFDDNDRIGADGRCKIWNARYAGKEALSGRIGVGRDHLGGRVLCISMQAHRVAWAIHYGEWPKDHIDHINGNGVDNRIINLRSATHQQNCINRGSRKGSSSKFIGVDVYDCERWRAQIKPVGKPGIYLGLFDSEEAAAHAYDAEAKKVHGEWARLNFP